MYWAYDPMAQSKDGQIKITMGSVRTNFDLNPEQEWTQAQKARTINL